MNIAFVVFDYFPYGGLQRDMLAIAKVCDEATAVVRTSRVHSVRFELFA